MILQSINPPENQEKVIKDDIVLEASDDKYKLGEPVEINIRNNLDHTIWVDSECPSEPLRVDKYQNGVWESLEVAEGDYLACSNEEAELNDQKIFFVQKENFEVQANSDYIVDYSP